MRRIGVLPVFILMALPIAAEPRPEVRRLEVLLDGLLERATQLRPVQSAADPPQTAVEPEPSSESEDKSNPQVQRFVDYFRGEGAAFFSRSLRRLDRHKEVIERVFREAGLPRELLWLGLVESGYDPHARSSKDALGIWQLMPGTASDLGLHLEGRDERSDPEKSTRAAAKYLKSLYVRFGDWMLTLAAYNAGEQRVRRAIDSSGQSEFWRLAHLLPDETENYVAAVLAAQMVGEGRLNDGDETRQRTVGDVPIVYAPFALSP